MVEAQVLKAEAREKRGTRAARKQRAAGKVPAIIYGHQQEPVSVLLSRHDVSLELQHHHRLLTIELSGKQEKLLVKEVQYDHLGDTLIHMDLSRVDLEERVVITVGLEFKGTAHGLSEGGTLDQMEAEVEVECKASEIPDMLRVNLSGLEVGQSLTAGEIELPAGVVLVTSAETPVAMVRAKAEEEGEELSEEAAAEAGGAEPEVISREKEEEE